MVDRMIVYVSGPYTKGVVQRNVRAAIDAAEKIANAGHAPLCPHTHSHEWDLVYPHDWQFWLDLDLALIRGCDALVRLPGESAGADHEVDHARSLDIPVLYGVDEFLGYAEANCGGE